MKKGKSTEPSTLLLFQGNGCLCQFKNQVAMLVTSTVAVDQDFHGSYSSRSGKRKNDKVQTSRRIPWFT
jgi:hypothetical protein